MDKILDIKVYTQALREDDNIIYTYLQKEEELTAIKDLSSSIKYLINQTRSDLGIENIPPVTLDKEISERLKQKIKSQEQWQNYFNQLMDISRVPLESRIQEAITLPWWNANILHVSDEKYQQGNLSLNVSLAHSYITQLLRQGKIKAPSSKTMSISNNLITSDNFLVLGWRGGHNLADTIMSVPAGSVEYHSGENPIFESLYEELVEEVGLKKEDVDSAELLGKLSGGFVEHNPHYVTRVRTKKSLAEVLTHWNTALDNKEHKHLLVYPDDCIVMYNRIKDNQFDVSQINTADTTLAKKNNIGAILPHCAASILVHYISNGEIYKIIPNFNSSIWEKIYER